ncbi:hypothetical protein [Streptomyces sp. SID3343]|uniref:hypothetical protein n=1 Tax=Streptomyces sp. SID3343 TaxID=2690260 RepID=UPI001369718A|nr:hypothetical protein [Streptomyces sp. SID3343]MYW00236.1 hypothetical protein [Streptomyces sp. SID3343]
MTDIATGAARLRTLWAGLAPHEAAYVNYVAVCSPGALRDIATYAAMYSHGPGADVLVGLATGTHTTTRAELDAVLAALAEVAANPAARDPHRAHSLALRDLLVQDLGESGDTAQVRALYRERTHLLAVLAGMYASVLVESAPDLPEYALLVVRLPTGQITRHIHPLDLDLLTHVTRVAPDHQLARWDGTDTATSHDRLRVLARMLVTDVDEDAGA